MLSGERQPFRMTMPLIRASYKYAESLGVRGALAAIAVQRWLLRNMLCWLLRPPPWDCDRRRFAPEATRFLGRQAKVSILFPWLLCVGRGHGCEYCIVASAVDVSAHRNSQGRQDLYGAVLSPAAHTSVIPNP